MDAFIGIDVGTGSARAGVFDGDGKLLGTAKRDIRIWKEDGGIVEQSSNDIWLAVVESVRDAVARSGVAADDVKGLGFDATCSLVVLDQGGNPLSVGPSGDANRDIIVWMDHRAMDQTARINATGHEVLRYVGGAISPEMETPKLLWLKENKPDTFAQAGHFFDLADFLSWRATGCLDRSVCTVTCKWTYLAHESRWDRGYFRSIGLEELAENEFERIGAKVVDIATPLGQGLTGQAARELGLNPGTLVGASLIDAHAGGVGTLGGGGQRGGTADPAGELALIMGTSSCAMALTRDAAFVDGVWGPYYSALLPEYWLLEGGQSAYGAAIDYLVAMHPAFEAARKVAEEANMSVLDFLERRAVTIAGSAEAAAKIARGIHVVPEFLGNRAPEADPHATAVICGLTLDNGLDGLAKLFVAGLCGLCYGTRQIVEANRDKGVDLGTIVVSGGAARSALLRRILSDATGLKVALPVTGEPVLLGSAMVGAVASGVQPSLKAAAARMCKVGEVIDPASGEMADFHAAKFEAFRILQTSERRIRQRMASA